MRNTAWSGGGSDFHAVNWASIRLTRITHMRRLSSNVWTHAFFRVFAGLNAPNSGLLRRMTTDGNAFYVLCSTSSPLRWSFVAPSVLEPCFQFSYSRGYRSSWVRLEMYRPSGKRKTAKHCRPEPERAPVYVSPTELLLQYYIWPPFYST